jgi:hypothetical protein
LRKVTMPISTSSDEVWVFILIDHGAVDVARMAHLPGSRRFIALPVEAFNPRAVLPTYSATGELVDGYRWATTTDIETHADLFTA